MTIECYYSACRYHGVWDVSDDGPFCHESECRATEQELKLFAAGRKLERQGYNLAELDADNPYNQGAIL